MNKPYVSDIIVQNNIDARLSRLYASGTKVIEAREPFAVSKTRTRAASDVIILGDGYTEDQTKTLITLLEKDTLTTPIIATTYENYQYCIDNTGITPEFVFITTNELTKLQHPERSTFFYPINLPDPPTDVWQGYTPNQVRNTGKELFYYYSDIGHAKTVRTKFPGIMKINTNTDPLTTMIMILTRRMYVNLHLLSPLPTTDKPTVDMYQIKAIKAIKHATLENLISNTIFRYWLHHRQAYPKITINLHYPKGNIFGYKVKKVIKIW